LATRGDLYFATYKGKRRAILQVVKATKSKAIVVIRKGRAIKGMSSRAKNANSNLQGRTNKADKIGSQIRSNLSLGILAGFGLNYQDVVLSDNAGNNSETVAMSGNGVSVKVAGDYEINEDFGVRATVGIEQFNAYGEADTNLCDDLTTTECASELSFITLDGLLKWKYMTGSFTGWLGAGGGLLFPAASDSNALDSESIATTSIIYGATGVDIALSKTMYIPIQIDYGIIPPSSDVATSIIGFRGGLMWKF